MVNHDNLFYDGDERDFDDLQFEVNIVNGNTSHKKEPLKNANDFEQTH